jgi:hypothetical protein
VKAGYKQNNSAFDPEVGGSMSSESPVDTKQTNGIISKKMVLFITEVVDIQ